MHRVWHVRWIVYEPVRHRLCPGARQQPAWCWICRGRQLIYKPFGHWFWICRRRQFIYEPFGHWLCPGTRKRLAWCWTCRVGLMNANRLVTGCVPAPGSDRPGPGVGGVGSSYVGCFGLALPRGRVGVAVPDPMCPPPLL